MKLERTTENNAPAALDSMRLLGGDWIQSRNGSELHFGVPDEIALCHRKISKRNKPADTMKLCAECERNLRIAQAPLLSKIAEQEAVIHMTIARLGGTVEGRPTSRVNFLQRIDALVAANTANHKCANPACETVMSDGSPELCPKCQESVCPSCKGRKKIIWTHNEANTPSTTERKCPKCKGSGIKPPNEKLTD